MSDSSKQKLKKHLFALWDKTGANLDLDTLKYVGIDKPTRFSDFAQVHNFFRQYIGGNDVAINKLKELSNNTFHARVGGFDFKFKIGDYSLVEDELINNHIYLDNLVINLMPSGTVFVENENKRFFISDLFTMKETELQKKYGDFDEDIIYEIVNYEIDVVIKDVLENQITSKTGIEINTIIPSVSK